MQSEDKFAHLLQPIRDLASNWNIDIAHELEDYLEVLESLTFTFAQGGPSLNFAEAALLIQGSTCIYGKKVEYLHSLVYQALETVAERRARGPSKAGADGGADGDADDDNEFDDEERFLSLDDVLEEVEGIDLEKGGPSDAGPAPAVRPPATLLALEAADAAAGEGDAAAYRISSCAVHCSGALLLEPRDGDWLDEHLQPVARGTAPAGPSVAEQQPAPPGGWATAGGQGSDAPAPGLEACADDGGWGDDDGGMDYCDGGDAHDEYAGDAGGGAGAVAPGADVEGDGGRAAPRAPPAPRAPAVECDPYAPLDPNSRGSLPIKPFKKAARVARKPRQRTAPLWQPAAGADSLLSTAAPAASLLLPEFEYALGTLRQAEQRARRGASSHGASGRSSQTAALLGGPSADTAFGGGAGFADADLDDGDDDDGVVDYCDGGGGDCDGGDFGPAGELGALGTAEWAVDGGAAGAWAAAAGGGEGLEPDAGGMTYEELCRAHVESLLSAAAAAEARTELAARVAGWRARMAPELEEEDSRPEFDTDAYGERVLERMAALSCADPAGEPAHTAKAKAEAEAGDKEGPALSFGQVVAGVGIKYEVARTFSSTLQLVNNGNVRITKLGGGEEAAPSFTLTLLNPELPKRTMDAARAAGAAFAGAKAKLAVEEPPAAGENAASPEAAVAAKASKPRARAAAAGKRRKA